MKYRVFLRSTTNWKEYGSATKRTIRVLNTNEDARQFCNRWNAERSDTQIRNGTKAEFEAV